MSSPTAWLLCAGSQCSSSGKGQGYISPQTVHRGACANSVCWLCFHLLVVSLLPSFLDLSKPRNLKAKHHWNTIWFHIKTALPRQSSARAWVSFAACNCTLSLAPAPSGWFGGILHPQILCKYTKTQGTRPDFKNWAEQTQQHWAISRL